MHTCSICAGAIPTGFVGESGYGPAEGSSVQLSGLSGWPQVQDTRQAVLHDSCKAVVQPDQYCIQAPVLSATAAEADRTVRRLPMIIFRIYNVVVISTTYYLLPTTRLLCSIYYLLTTTIYYLLCTTTMYYVLPTACYLHVFHSV